MHFPSSGVSTNRQNQINSPSSANPSTPNSALSPHSNSDADKLSSAALHSPIGTISNHRAAAARMIPPKKRRLNSNEVNKISAVIILAAPAPASTVLLSESTTSTEMHSFRTLDSISDPSSSSTTIPTPSLPISRWTTRSSSSIIPTFRRPISTTIVARPCYSSSWLHRLIIPSTPTLAPPHHLPPTSIATTSSTDVCHRRRATSLPLSPLSQKSPSFTPAASIPMLPAFTAPSPSATKRPRLDVHAIGSLASPLRLAIESSKTLKDCDSGLSLGNDHREDDQRRRRVKSCVSLSMVLATPMTPPITRDTLRELDLHEILDQPQLRHDLVLDSRLLFRPNNDGERGAQKREIAERYWSAVSREITMGCKCTAFTRVDGMVVLFPCLCSQLTLVDSLRLSSRIPTLILELRNIILSLLPTSPTSPNGSPSPTFQQTITARELVEQTLDPATVARQIQDNTFDPSVLADCLGDAMKVHCAPMRDGGVDKMMDCFRKGEIVSGLRNGFEVLELMKLDIVNHQLRSLRPRLIETAINLEVKLWKGMTSSPQPDMPRLDKSRGWIHQAYDAMKDRIEKTETITAKDVARSVRFGLVTFLFPTISSNMSSTTTLTSSPPSLSTFSTTTVQQERIDAKASSSSRSAFPETLNLDAARIGSLQTDVKDLTVVYLLLLLYRQISLPRIVDAAEISTVKKEILIILRSSRRKIVRRPTDDDEIYWAHGEGRRKMDDVLLQLAARSSASASTSTSTADQSSTHLPLPHPNSVALLGQLFDANIVSTSSLYQLLQSRLRSSIGAAADLEGAKIVESERTTKVTLSAFQSLSIRVVGRGEGCTARNGDWPLKAGEMAKLPCEVTASNSKANADLLQQEPSSSEIKAMLDQMLRKTELVSLKSEVLSIGERVSKLEIFHLKIYGEWYADVLRQPSA